ncbi:hypothetical protein N480_22400 [Pseudoalteromonas luteoviolacea S2607]|uniref:SMI1/KNR4 family protein n=1 Tax=Pseudoalteromonas luteoviolacea TaxID=43657 RepID=UPI0007B04D7D|nr:SMI1/KNR4 family protein [Pseudoalteromonas luteoviolacea]KZN34357.1 hypothetical protein N480_22400 [Pseudoalteromonas luteoviolacea S2607]
MYNLDNVLKSFSSKDGFRCHGELDSTLIASMESDLGIAFPEEYKKFLMQYGYIEWFGHTIYGYATDEDYHTVLCTKELREDELPHNFKRIPNEGCVLESYGGGGYYFLYSEESEKAGRVSLFLDELYGQEAHSWGSFGEFLEYMLGL